MLNMLGLRLHPAIGIAAGLALVAVGVIGSVPMLCLVGGVVLLAVASRWFGSREPRSPVATSEEARSGDGSPR